VWSMRRGRSDSWPVPRSDEVARGDRSGGAGKRGDSARTIVDELIHRIITNRAGYDLRHCVIPVLLPSGAWHGWTYRPLPCTCDVTSCPGIHARVFYWNRQERDHATAHARNRQASACRRHRAGLGMIGTRTTMILKALVCAARVTGLREGAFRSNGKTALAKNDAAPDERSAEVERRLRLVQDGGRLRIRP
jgi:hypothetical protein